MKTFLHHFHLVSHLCEAPFDVEKSGSDATFLFLKNIMQGYPYLVKIETRRLSPFFDDSQYRFSPVRDIEFTVFAYDYDMARTIAIEMSTEAYGHEYNEDEGDIMDIEKIKTEEDEEGEKMMGGTSSNMDYSILK